MTKEEFKEKIDALIEEYTSASNAEYENINEDYISLEDKSGIETNVTYEIFRNDEKV